MENFKVQLLEWAQFYGLKVLAAIAILLIGRILVGIITSFVSKLLRKAKVDETLNKFISSLTKIFMLTVVIIASLNALGVQTTSLVAILGAAGLAVGFALQSSLSNFAAGVMLIIFRPFTTGDYVEAGGTSGSVEEIRIFNTVMKTPDNKKVIIPNGNIIGNNIVNYSAEEHRRGDMVFGIGYDDDLKKAKEILNRLVNEDDRILKDPATTVAGGELADSSVNFVVRHWVKTADYWGVFYDFTEKVKLTFDAEGISIPYPQQDIHMHQVKENI